MATCSDFLGATINRDIIRSWELLIRKWLPLIQSLAMTLIRPVEECEDRLACAVSVLRHPKTWLFEFTPPFPTPTGGQINDQNPQLQVHRKREAYIPRTEVRLPCCEPVIVKRATPGHL